MSYRTTRPKRIALLLLIFTLGSFHVLVAQDGGPVASGGDGEGPPLIERVRAAYARLEDFTQASEAPAHFEISQIAEGTTAEIADRPAAELLTFDTVYTITLGRTTTEDPLGTTAIYTLSPQAVYATLSLSQELSLRGLWELAQSHDGWRPDLSAIQTDPSLTPIPEFDRYVAYDVRLEIDAAVLSYKALGLYRSSTDTLALMDVVVPVVHRVTAEPAAPASPSGRTPERTSNVMQLLTMGERRPLCHEYHQFGERDSDSNSGTSDHLIYGSHSAAAEVTTECVCTADCKSKCNPFASAIAGEIGVVGGLGGPTFWHIPAQGEVRKSSGVSEPDPFTGIGPGSHCEAGAAACVRKCFTPFCSTVIGIGAEPIGVEVTLPEDCIADGEAKTILLGRPCSPCTPFAFRNDGRCDPEENHANSPEDCRCGDGICDSSLGETPETCADCQGQQFYLEEGGYCRTSEGHVLRPNGTRAQCRQVDPSQPPPPKVYKSCEAAVAEFSACPLRYEYDFKDCRRADGWATGPCKSVEPTTENVWGGAYGTCAEALGHVQDCRYAFTKECRYGLSLESQGEWCKEVGPADPAYRTTISTSCLSAWLGATEECPQKCGQYGCQSAQGENQENCCFDCGCKDQYDCLTSDITKTAPEDYRCQCANFMPEPTECGEYRDACGELKEKKCPPGALDCVFGHCTFPEPAGVVWGGGGGFGVNDWCCDQNNDGYVAETECTQCCGGHIVTRDYEGTPVKMCQVDTAITAECGDGQCDGNETCSSCSADCGTCPPPPPFCGDGLCNGSETCISCQTDCGACPPPPPACGDRVCNGSETCSTCASDCGACPPPPPVCGDGLCNGSETCSSCQADCGVCPPPPPACGDGVCIGSESCSSCPSDCGGCSFCGNHKCDADESCSSCPADCGLCEGGPASCGNGLCESGETCGTCSADCGSCAPPPPPGPVCGDGMCNGSETCATCGRDCGASCTSLGARCGTMIDNGCGYMLNCGTCPGGSTCTADHRCICPDGKPPKVWYVDCDKDGFPPSWATGPAYFVESCAKPTVGPASCPQGSWTSGVPDAPRKTDCGDSSALARPGQTGFFQTGYTVDGVTSFDYDCDGKTTLEFGIPTSSTTCTADSGFCDGPVNYLNNGLPATPPCGAWRQISFCDEDPNNPLRCVRSKKFTYAKCR